MFSHAEKRRYRPCVYAGSRGPFSGCFSHIRIRLAWGWGVYKGSQRVVSGGRVLRTTPVPQPKGFGTAQATWIGGLFSCSCEGAGATPFGTLHFAASSLMMRPTVAREVVKVLAI